MNLNTLAFLIRDDVTTIRCYFSPSSTGSYTYKVTRELAQALKPDDIVLVEHDTAYVKWATVSEIHDEPQVDPEDGINYRWAFAAVPFSQLQSLKQEEQLIVDRLQARRKASHRQQALAALGITDPAAFMKGITSHTEEA